MGLTEKYRSPDERFEVDGANAARRFLGPHGVPEAAIDVVWDAIALHTTPGIPKWKKPEVALVTAGVELDVLGLGYDDVPADAREQVLAAFPRVDFKRRIVAGVRRRDQAQAADWPSATSSPTVSSRGPGSRQSTRTIPVGSPQRCGALGGSNMKSLRPGERLALLAVLVVSGAARAASRPTRPGRATSPRGQRVPRG